MRRRAALLLVGCLLAPGVARADVVHLANGNQIQGSVVEETPEQVVVRTLHGRMTIPRKEVARVERESAARTLLRQARFAAETGDRARAERLFEEALDAGDPAVATAARAELDALRARPAPAAPAAPGKAAKVDRWDGRGDPFVEDEREALIRELEEAVAARPELGQQLLHELYRRGERRHEAGDCRLAASDYRRALRWAPADAVEPLQQRERRCRVEVAGKALRRGEAALAREAARPVVADADLGRVAGYYLGRSEELLRRPDAARAAFLATLGAVRVPADRDLATLRELARLASAGLPIDARTPGIAPGWRHVQTDSFSVLLEQGVDAALPDGLEAARGEVIARLDLKRLDDLGRIALIVFASARSYDGSPGARSWSAGHATRLRAQDEVVPTIYLHTEGDVESRLRHELAHILVGDALDDARLPMWTQEGAAIHAETEASRRQWREYARALAAQGGLRPAGAALGQMLLPMTDDAKAIGAFYVQAALLFDVLAARLGPTRTLAACTHINTDGAEGALRGAGLSVADVEADCRAAVERR